MTPPKGSKLVTKAKARPKAKPKPKSKSKKIETSPVIKPKSKVLKKKAGQAVGKREPVKQAKAKKAKPGRPDPPKEYQFKPGQSGNPKGPPKGRTQVWRWVCKYMDMPAAELNKLKVRSLTLSQQAALKIARNMAKGNMQPGTQMAKYVIDRSEGKIPETLNVTRTDELSHEDCESVRAMLKARND